MVRSGDQHRVDIVTLDHLAEVAVGRHTGVTSVPEPLPIVFCYPLPALGRTRLPHIADGQYLHVIPAR